MHIKKHIKKITSLLFQIWEVSKISIGFIALSFISSDFSFSAFCCFLFLSTLFKPRLINIATIFVISIFIDINNGIVIGGSLCQFLMTYFGTLRFKTFLLNNHEPFGIFFFFLLLSATEFLYFLVTALFCRFDLLAHFNRIFNAVLLCSLYYFVIFIKRKVKKRYDG